MLVWRNGGNGEIQRPRESEREIERPRERERMKERERDGRCFVFA